VTTLLHPRSADHLFGQRTPRLLKPSALRAIALSFVPQVKERRFGAGSAVRTWDLLAESEDYEAWVIGWPPAGSIELHDHGKSVGAVVVVSGELIETKIVPLRKKKVETKVSKLLAGDAVELKSHCVHDVVNQGSETAVSIHVYSPRLTSMTYYGLEDGVLDPVRTVQYHSLSDREP